MYENVTFGTLVSCDMSQSDSNAPPMPHEISALGMVLKTHFDGDAWTFEVLFVHPYSLFGIVSTRSEDLIIWGQAADASDAQITQMVTSHRLDAREVAAMVRVIKLFLKIHAAPTPNEGDWVAYNGKFWKARPGSLGELSLHSPISPPYEISLKTQGIEIPGPITQRAVSWLVTENERLQRKLNEAMAEPHRRW